MNTYEELHDLNNALGELRGWLSGLESDGDGPLHQLRHFAAVERSRAFGTGCHDYWNSAVKLLDAFADFEAANVVHDAHHEDEPISLFGVEGKHQEDGTMRFDFDDPKEPA